MKRLLLIAPFALLAACSEQDICISRATSQLRTINSLVAETQGNLARGYALEERQELRERDYVCRIDNGDGTVSEKICTDVQTFTRRVPVAIDLNAEQAKLDSLIERQALEQRRADAAVQQCRIQFPE